MSVNVNDQELESVLKLPPPKRYQYFLGKITDWNELWSIGDEHGWGLMGDDSGQELIPVWPAQCYAALACVGKWQSRSPRSISLKDWLNKWTPGMIADGRRVAVFPLPNDRGIVVEPSKLQRDIEVALSAYE